MVGGLHLSPTTITTTLPFPAHATSFCFQLGTQSSIGRACESLLWRGGIKKASALYKKTLLSEQSKETLMRCAACVRAGSDALIRGYGMPWDEELVDQVSHFNHNKRKAL